MGNYQNSASLSNISLNIFHQNLQSFRNKKVILEVLLHDELANVDVLGLTEHWLMADEIGYFSLPGYSLISSYCRKNKKKGGSCIYMKSNIVVKPITKFDYLNVDEYFEASIVKLEQFKLIIICIYKNPNSNIKILLDNLEIILEHFEKANN